MEKELTKEINKIKILISKNKIMGRDTVYLQNLILEKLEILRKYEIEILKKEFEKLDIKHSQKKALQQ